MRAYTSHDSTHYPGVKSEKSVCWEWICYTKYKRFIPVFTSICMYHLCTNKLTTQLFLNLGHSRVFLWSLNMQTHISSMHSTSYPAVKSSGKLCADHKLCILRIYSHILVHTVKYSHLPSFPSKRAAAVLLCVLSGFHACVNLFWASSLILGRKSPSMASACVMLLVSLYTGTGRTSRSPWSCIKPLSSCPCRPSMNLPTASSMLSASGCKTRHPQDMDMDPLHLADPCPPPHRHHGGVPCYALK